MVVVLVPATKVPTVVPPEMLTPTWSTLSINSSIRKKNNFHLKTVWLSWSQGSMNFDPTACQRSERQAVDSSCKAFWGSDSLRCSHLIRWRCRGGWRSALLCSGPRAGRWPLHCRSTESRPSHTHRLWWSTFRCCSSAGIRYLRSAQGGDRSPANAVENRCASLRSQLCCLKDREDKETRRHSATCRAYCTSLGTNQRGQEASRGQLTPTWTIRTFCFCSCLNVFSVKESNIKSGTEVDNGHEKTW